MSEPIGAQWASEGDVAGEAWGSSAADITMLGESGHPSITLDSIMGKPDAPKSAGGSGGMFSMNNIGGTLQGIGAIAGAAAGIYDAHNKKKYQDKVFRMEEDRVNREKIRQDKQQANYEKVFG